MKPSIEFDHHNVTDQNFVEVWEAKNPSRIVVTVPHDGKPNYAWPDKLRDRRRAVTGGDPGVWLIAKDLIFPKGKRLAITTLTSVVRANIPRGVVDLNRSYPETKSYYSRQRPQPALDNQRYAPAYEHYHQQIKHLLRDSVHHYGPDGCLLVDLHGFSRQPNYAPSGGFDLILGTGNRTTIPHGDIDLEFGDFMRSKGYRVFVPGKHSAKHQQEDRYAAEHTTHYYSQKYGINAIQIETAKRFRDKKEGKKIGPKLSKDLTQFFNHHFNRNRSID